MTANVVMVTGISGCGSRAFCRRVEEQEGQKVKLYHSGDLIEEIAKTRYGIPRENLLNIDPQKLMSIRDIAFDKIVEGIRNTNADKVLIDTHGQFFWNNVYTNAYNWKYLNQIKPNLFITIIDKPSSIKERQMKTAQGKCQDHSIADILLWQNIEVNVTKGWAENYGTPMYVLPSKQNPEILDNLLKNKFLIYYSMPMTYASDEAKQKISDFKAKMVKIGKELTGFPTPIIDPRDIDIDSEIGLDAKTTMVNEDQTVHRDLDWYIDEATHVVVYYPEGSTISLGVSHEVIRAHESGKDVYIICSMKKLSPFIRKSHKVFGNEEEFFEFFPKHMKEKIEQYKR